MFQGDPYCSEYTRAKPDEKDLVGVWVANARSIEWLKEKGYAVASPPSLEIRADGTFDMRAMPDCWRVFFDKEWKKVLESGSGKWSVQHVQDWYALEMDFHHLNGKDWQCTFSNHFNLRRQKSPYMVHVTVGDPDSGDCIEFEKQ
jgi:hypothetical protein